LTYKSSAGGVGEYGWGVNPQTGRCRGFELTAHDTSGCSKRDRRNSLTMYNA